MKKFKVYFVILILTVLATGCSKRQDVEDQSFVMAMGIERINKEKLLFRYSYADLDKAQSDSGTKIPSSSMTVLAKMQIRNGNNTKASS